MHTHISTGGTRYTLVPFLSALYSAEQTYNYRVSKLSPPKSPQHPFVHTGRKVWGPLQPERWPSHSEKTWPSQPQPRELAEGGTVKCEHALRQQTCRHPSLPQQCAQSCNCSQAQSPHTDTHSPHSTQPAPACPQVVELCIQGQQELAREAGSTSSRSRQPPPAASAPALPPLCSLCRAGGARR